MKAIVQGIKRFGLNIIKRDYQQNTILIYDEINEGMSHNVNETFKSRFKLHKLFNTTAKERGWQL